MRTLLVTGDKTFKLDIPDDAKLTFGPWSPPKKNGGFGPDGAKGTLRVYQGTKENIIACFSGVESFREISAVGYAEQVAKEEGATVWKSDHEGYVREEKVTRKHEWKPDTALVAPAKPTGSKARVKP